MLDTPLTCETVRYVGISFLRRDEICEPRDLPDARMRSTLPPQHSPLCSDTHYPHPPAPRATKKRHTTSHCPPLSLARKEAMVRRSWSTLAAAWFSATGVANANFEASTITTVTPEASAFDTRSTLPYGCPPDGCVAANTRVSTSSIRHYCMYVSREVGPRFCGDDVCVASPDVPSHA